jgi:hypothetical protein
LNITVVDGEFYYYAFVNNRTGELPAGFTLSGDSLYYYNTTREVFDTTKLRENGACQPTSTYKWGFSFLILFICLLLLLIWSIGTYIMWLKAHLTLRANGKPEPVGEYKAVIELAAAMNNEFSKHNENTEFLRERQIQGKIRHAMNGGTMWYDLPNQEKEFTFWKGFKRWAKKDKWWWPAYLFPLMLNLLSVRYGPHVFLVSSVVFTGIFITRTVGRSTKSRCLIVLIFTILTIITVIAVTLAP